LQHDFRFFVNLMTFFFFQVIKYSLFIFIFHISTKFQTKYIYECFQSHCHILKELHDFLCMMGATTIFEKIVSYLILGVMNL